MDATDLIQKCVDTELPVSLNTDVLGRVEVRIGHPQHILEVGSFYKAKDAMAWLERQWRLKRSKDALSERSESDPSS
jgi:hypothetical protein